MTFYELLTAAINDLAEHGYDSADRVAEWVELLRKSANASCVPLSVAENSLRTTFGGIYKRLVDDGGVLRANPGVGRFTLEKVKPQLRAELDRRLMASANLIKLHRETAIDTTLRRFQGWATSLPVGGSADPERMKTKLSVRKSLASLPFTERRVAIDQGHKLTAAINHVVAIGGGAIAARWNSHVHQLGYNARPDHAARDYKDTGKVYLVRDSWAHRLGFVKPGKGGYLDDITQPGEEVFCRCSAKYLFSLRQLPDDMITVAGREALERAREMAKVA